MNGHSQIGLHIWNGIAAHLRIVEIAFTEVRALPWLLRSNRGSQDSQHQRPARNPRNRGIEGLKEGAWTCLAPRLGASQGDCGPAFNDRRRRPSRGSASPLGSLRPGHQDVSYDGIQRPAGVAPPSSKNGSSWGTSSSHGMPRSRGAPRRCRARRRSAARPPATAQARPGTATWPGMEGYVALLGRSQITISAEPGTVQRAIGCPLL